MINPDQYTVLTPKRILLWVVTLAAIIFGVSVTVFRVFTLFDMIPAFVMGAVVLAFIVKVIKIWNGDSK